jgi:hypothetical protein
VAAPPAPQDVDPPLAKHYTTVGATTEQALTRSLTSVHGSVAMSAAEGVREALPHCVNAPQCAIAIVEASSCQFLGSGKWVGADWRQASDEFFVRDASTKRHCALGNRFSRIAAYERSRRDRSRHHTAGAHY